MHSYNNMHCVIKPLLSSFLVNSFCRAFVCLTKAHSFGLEANKNPDLNFYVSGAAKLASSFLLRSCLETFQANSKYRAIWPHIPIRFNNSCIVPSKRKISGRVVGTLVERFNFGMCYSTVKNSPFQHFSILLFTIIGDARTVCAVVTQLCKD